MKPGDIVTTLGDKVLASGAARYDCAVVISMTPFILTSLASDMRWSATVQPDQFAVSGQADAATLARCLRRLHD